MSGTRRLKVLSGLRTLRLAITNHFVPSLKLSKPSLSGCCRPLRSRTHCQTMSSQHHPLTHSIINWKLLSVPAIVLLFVALSHLRFKPQFSAVLHFLSAVGCRGCLAEVPERLSFWLQSMRFLHGRRDICGFLPISGVERGMLVELEGVFTYILRSLACLIDPWIDWPTCVGPRRGFGAWRPNSAATRCVHWCRRRRRPRRSSAIASCFRCVSTTASRQRRPQRRLSADRQERSCGCTSMTVASSSRLHGVHHYRLHRISSPTTRRCTRPV